MSGDRDHLPPLIFLYPEIAHPRPHPTPRRRPQELGSNGLLLKSRFVRHSAAPTAFLTDEAWVILSPIEQSIKRKIEAVGTPLKDWDVQINYGIKTGCNEAFIISTEKRNEILSTCQDEAERSRTAALIRPILRGRDIKRYGYEWKDLWLIWIPWHFPYHLDPSIQGASIVAEEAFKEQYPAVYQHLLQYKDVLSKRNQAETGIRYEWYALQRWGAKYWEDFLKPKIVWKRVGSILRFGYDDTGALALDSTCFATGKDIRYLCGVLNSKMGRYLLKDAPQTGTGDLLISVQAVEPLLIPLPIEPMSEKLHISDDEVYDLYGLSSEQRAFVDSAILH